MSKLKLPEDHPYAGGRVCTTCNEFKPAEEYGVTRDSRSFKGIAMRTKCRPCYEHQKYKAFIKRRYGITWEDYEKMNEAQNGCCAVCGSDDTSSSRTYGRLFIDHCHDTNEVRGLLCMKCNMGLGYFNDNPDLLDQAIQYLILSRIH